MADMNLKKMGKWMNDQLGSPTHEEVMEERRAFLETVQRSSSSPSPVRIIRWAAAAAVVFGISAYVAISLFTHSPSDSQVSAGAEKPVVPSVAGYKMHTTDNGGQTIEFDSGSTFTVHAGSDADITHNTAEEVRLLLHTGYVDCAINGNGFTKWHINAGSYTVTVTGTQFSVDWTPKENHLDVRVTEGSVLVSGGKLNADGIRLSMGETVSVRPDAVRIGKVNDGASIDESLAQADAQDLAASAHSRKHQIKNIVSKQLSYNQLWSQSKKARYAGDHDTAYRLLTELRTRFANKPYAKQAAFILGRICLESRQAPMEAKQWFETYLQNTPDGPLVEESIGRLIRVCDQLHHPCARRYANQYLSQYPNGVFAEIATSVIE
ncbi:MAG: FecR domain-containing protein [Deltaproteobacteria bacterium]|nr:FecR domain-containing protein [Deltaproteobacteria bacterium]MBN2674249.1 FecR domain-containing protein [Deltaproteobacteria bacterium]